MVRGGTAGLPRKANDELTGICASISDVRKSDGPGCRCMMKLRKLIWIGGLMSTALLLGTAHGETFGHSPSVLSVTERTYLGIYNFHHETEIGTDDPDNPIYESWIVPVQYDIADFVIHGEWAPGEVDGWSFEWNDWSFSWNLSEPEGRRHPAADHNPFFDFTYYGFDLYASSPELSIIAGGLGGFPDRFPLIDEGTIFEDLSGIVYSWDAMRGIGEGPYFGDNLVQTISYFDYLTQTGDELIGEGLLSFSVGFDEDGMWTRLVMGERLGIVPEPSTVGLFGLGILLILRLGTRNRAAGSSRAASGRAELLSDEVPTRKE